MRSLIIIFIACGALASARAEDISDKPADRVSLQTLRNIRDPFKRLDTGIQDVGEAKSKSELESTPVGDFKMVGVLTGPYRTRGLVRSPSGNVFPVSDGMKIGIQNGYVRKVLPDRIIINEIMQDVLGEKELVTSELKLNSKGVEKGVSNVTAISLPSDTAKANPNAKGDALSSIAPSLKQDAPAPASTPSAPKTASAAAPASAPASTSSAPITGSFNGTVPPPVSLPSTSSNNGPQTGVSK